MTRYILHNWKDTWTPQPLGRLGLRAGPLTLPRNLYHRPFQETECHQRTWRKFMRSYIRSNDTERERKCVQTSGKALRVGMHWFRPVSLPLCRHVNSGLESRQYYSSFSLKGWRERECEGQWVWVHQFICVTHMLSDAEMSSYRGLIWSDVALPFLFFFWRKLHLLT